MKGPALVVMAKWPEPGRVKTRLCPPLTPEEACALYEAMLRDVLEAAAAFPGVSVIVGYHPPERRADFEQLAGQGAVLLEQCGEHLAARMQGCFAEAFSRGFAPVLMRNSDAPTMPAKILTDAIAALADGAQAAFSPDASSGFGVIGLAEDTPKLLEKPLETANSYEEIRARCAAAGIKAAEVGRWYDVDSAADLKRLLEEWRAGEMPRHVRRLLDECGGHWAV